MQGIREKIFVADKSVCYGYDLLHVKIDRNRRMIRGFVLQCEVGRIWAEVMTKEEARREKLANNAFQLLEKDYQEVRNIKYNVYEDSSALVALYDAWKEAYGKSAYPVSTMAKSQEISYLSASGVFCSNAMRETLQKRTR